MACISTPGNALRRKALPLLLAGLFPVAAAGSDGVPASPAVPAIVSKAPVALLVDLSSGQTLYAHSADRRFLPASVAKAMTSLVAFDLIAAGRLSENTVVSVRPETAARWAGKGTTLSLRPNEAITIGELLQGTATVSANDAAVALAEAAQGSTAAWTAAMNARARQLGMTGSHFATPNGFPDHGATYVTAQDLVKLAQALIIEHPQLYRRYIGQQAMLWRGARLVSHDPFAGVLPGADGIKTGHTFEAGFNFLGAVERNGRRLVLVVAGLWSEPERARTATALAEWGYSAWDDRPWLAPGMIVGEVRVQRGTARTVPVTVLRGYTLSLPHGTSPRVSSRITYNGPLIAPVAKGTRLGELEVRIDGEPGYAIPVIAARDVRAAGPFDRLANGLLGLLQ
ncbi:MAG: D-alanyl-D-alanine carboxypeptidase [Sphingomonadales bacterium]|nr:D-alanyl-D-alanine carboxypeptidase [Sphingomonadales bacterium]